MISVDHTLGLPQIVLSSEVFQMAEYNYTKPSELFDHDYACSPYEESSIITIHKGSEDEENKENGQKMVKNAKLSKKRKHEALQNSQENRHKVSLSLFDESDIHQTHIDITNFLNIG